MIWRCACGRPNLETHIRCVDCGDTRPSAEAGGGSEQQGGEETHELIDTPRGPDLPEEARWQQRRPPGPGFVGRALRRTVVHYRRVLGLFLPALILVVFPIQIGYLRIAGSVVEGKAASWSTLAISAVLTVLLTLASYYLIVLTAFSVRDEEIALEPFYTRLPWGNLGALWLATVIYGLSIFFGFLMVIVPGLVALTLFCLVQPLVVLDEASVIEALRASPRLVIGRGGVQTLQVFFVILLMELALTGVSFLVLAPLTALASRLASPGLAYLFEVVVGGLFFPFHAVMLTILYDELVGIPRPRPSK